MRCPTSSWLSPEVEVRRSGIEGFGLFAVRGLAAGTVVERLGGRVIDDAELAALEPPYSSLTVAEGTHLLLDPAHPVRYGNHSCEPNLWHVDATTIALRTDVAADDELTIDYATHTGVPDWSMACSCGSTGCRGVVTGQDWRRAELRAAYGAHWTPALLARIATG
jgi:SET domain-containing protein